VSKFLRLRQNRPFTDSKSENSHTVFYTLLELKEVISIFEKKNRSNKDLIYIVSKINEINAVISTDKLLLCKDDWIQQEFEPEPFEPQNNIEA
jgi:hypothetical protein